MRQNIPSKRTSGFTLVELLVVIAIITILAGVVTVSLVHKPAEARVAAAKLQIKQLQTALNIYRTEQGRFPTQEQGLDALVRIPDREPIPRTYPRDGYLDGTRLPLDPWNNPFIYLTPGRSGESYEIISYGSDGEPGGTDDASDISSSAL
ncbi:MAG: type II secretion system major pseudopilin GspG [Kiritimatiellae bacterium]|nr:type II secretion system major pseudopilin GspG [Kiritimatiellia bacterium]MCO5069145.1 type II secretion system major pseudopilin GspG [Kiritimatiellia bacterium]